MQTRLRKLLDSLRSSYWFVPLVMMALTTAVWLITTGLDHSLSAKDKKTIAWLYLSDPDTMRTLLLTIAGAIVGIVGVVFSIIMVPLSIAASQFGPRLLRNFLRDAGTQITLGNFTSTFLFCMLVLLHLSKSTMDPLPQISVNVALLLGLLSFGTLIYFINHVAVTIQAPVLVATVSRELHGAIENEFPEEPAVAADRPAAGEKRRDLFDEAGSKRAIMSDASGYVQARDNNMLMRLASQHNLVLQLLAEPGDFIVKGTPLAIVWQEKKSMEAERTVNAAYLVGSNRTLVQDVTFGVNELVEVATRALSPAINDPFTAMTCLDWLGSALCFMCNRQFPSRYLFDESGSLRIISNPVTFTSMANAAFNQIREYGRNSRNVTLRIMQTIKVVALCARTEEQREALLHHARLVERSSHIGLPEAADRVAVAECYRSVMEMLTVI